ncbi:MAG: MMPL family transporter [Actinomycetales bacterium]|nr:MMPL family transporter [Actinomycetales bacterium]
MKKLAKLISGRRSAASVMLLGLIFAAGAFMMPAQSESAPAVGLSSNNETMVVADVLADLPGQDGTAAILVFRTKDGSAMTAEQQAWVLGTAKTVSPAPGAPSVTTYVGGVNERFADFSNVEIQGKKVVAPATLSSDKSTASVVVSMDAIDAEAPCAPVGKTTKLEACTTVQLTALRAAELRATASDNLPIGLVTALTGPEGFQADLNNVFAGANFTLLGTTALVVILLLLITYRSPVLWIIPLAVIGTADAMSSRLAAETASWFGINQLDGSVTGILSVLVFGAGTDYALLMISRYREELLKHENRRDAMFAAWRGAAPAIFASGMTVILALSTLELAELQGTRALGIACATGVAVAMISALFVLPAALVSFGRWIFWPVAPKVGGKNKSENGLWAKLGRGVSKRPVIIGLAGLAVLGILASSAPGVKIGLSANEQFVSKPEAVVGAEYLSAGFGSETTVDVIAKNGTEDAVAAAAKTVAGVKDAQVAKLPGTGAVLAGKEYTKLTVTLKAESLSEASFATITALRDKLKTVEGASAKVGGQEAQQLEVTQAYERDTNKIIPIILGLVFLVLLLLLRSIVAPVLLMVTVVGSFFASLGAGWYIFTHFFGYPALDLSVYLFSFLFLVALGVDYNIFLVTRAQEESGKLGLRQGMIKALASTGGVITSAGILLAAVFAVLGVLPLIALLQVGVIVCIGVLLDTLLVRTVIVPALAFIAGENFWWPRKPKVAVETNA